MISMGTKASVFTDARVFMSKENTEDIVCGVRGIGYFVGYEDELQKCVSTHLKKGYLINEEKSTYDLNKLKASLIESESAEESKD